MKGPCAHAEGSRAQGTSVEGGGAGVRASAQGTSVGGGGAGGGASARGTSVGGRGAASGGETPEALLPQEGAVAWSQDGACPQRCPSSPSPEVGPRDGPGPSQPAGLGADNPLLAPPVPSTKLFSQDVRQLPSGAPAAASWCCLPR